MTRVWDERTASADDPAMASDVTHPLAYSSDRGVRDFVGVFVRAVAVWAWVGTAIGVLIVAGAAWQHRVAASAATVSPGWGATAVQALPLLPLALASVAGVGCWRGRAWGRRVMVAALCLFLLAVVAHLAIGTMTYAPLLRRWATLTPGEQIVAASMPEWAVSMLGSGVAPALLLYLMTRPAVVNLFGGARVERRGPGA